ncbi:MAG: helix-turn-helix domain-containing protein [Panacagrimonas sp.]
MIDHASYGQQIARCYHLDDVPALSVRPQDRSPITYAHVQCGANRGMTAPLPRLDTYLLVIQLGEQCSKELWLSGKALPPRPCPKGTLLCLNLELDPGAYLRSPFDSLQIVLPQAALEDLADEQGGGRVSSLNCPQGISLDDPVVQQLGTALLPSIHRPKQASNLFVEHLSLALLAHLALTYGGLRRPPPIRGGLAVWQVRRAREMLSANLAHNVSVAEVARECRVSVSHFSRAFKQSTGMPPHIWLMHRRVEAAKVLMGEVDRPLAEIAGACGFADQSHMTRTFRKLTSATPGLWRRDRAA